MGTRLCIVCQLAIGLGWPAIAGHAALAQTPAANAALSHTGKSRPEKPGSRWHLTPALRVDVGFDDNVFLLQTSKKDNVAAPSAADVTSGRYAGMESANDVLTTLSTAVALKGPGLLGKTSVVSPAVDYELYTRNSERSNVRLGLSLEQELWAESRLRLQGRLTPSYFAKNYLADAVDGDGNGSVSDAERVYAGGEYRESELGAGYRFPLARSSRKRPFGAELQLDGGYYGRTYDAPFTGRDLKGPTAGAKLLLDLGRRVSLALAYDFASLSATPMAQVQLLDEIEFGQDFNGNGTATDVDARALTMVDRSRREQSLGTALSLDLSRAADLALGYEHRWRRYTSEQPLDVSNNGRRDTRNQASARLRLKLAKDLRLRLGGIRSVQSLNRAGDPGSTGEIDDYTRYQGSLGLSYEL